MKKTIRILSLLFILTTILSVCITANAKSAHTYAKSEHPNWFTFKGYAQVRGSYKIPKNPGYSLDKYVGKYIKQVAIQYKIPNGGNSSKEYTGKARSKSDYNTYWVSLNFMDSLNPWANKTEFYRWYTAF